jgi:hypothetical protein
LKGFSQTQEMRRFAFDDMEEEAATRSPYIVQADLRLIRTHGIRIQELPLLCRKLLERLTAQSTWNRKDRDLVLTDLEMGQISADRTTQQNEADKRKAPRRRPTENTGSAWRTTAPLSIRNHE